VTSLEQHTFIHLGSIDGACLYFQVMLVKSFLSFCLFEFELNGSNRLIIWFIELLDSVMLVCLWIS